MYWNMRSKSAIEPLISTPRCSRFAIGNSRRAWIVVNATMSPRDMRSVSLMMNSPPTSQMKAGAMVKNACTTTKKPRPVMYCLIDSLVNPTFVA